MAAPRLDTFEDVSDVHLAVGNQQTRLDARFVQLTSDFLPHRNELAAGNDDHADLALKRSDSIAVLAFNCAS